MFLYTLRTSKFSQNASSFTYDLKASGWRFLCTELAIVIHFESIWSHQGTHFGSLFGTRLAQKEPRWAQEDHQEPQSSENLQLQKPQKTLVFSRFLGFQGLPKQHLKTQKRLPRSYLGLLEAILKHLGAILETRAF